MKDVSLEIVEVGLDDLLDPCSGWFFEAPDSQCPRFGGVVITLLGLEREVGSEDLLHEQRCGDRFEHVIYRYRYLVLAGVGFCNEVRELSTALAFAVASDAPDDLDYFCQ